jgi:hypothetical protein
MPSSRPTKPPCLHLIPGTVRVLFLVCLDHAASVMTVPPPRFLEGLRAATDLLGFHGLQREEDRLDELLPWAGAV